MSSEFSNQIKKAYSHLGVAHKMFELGFFEEAGRAAYLAGFNAAQGYVFEITGQVFKSHNGLHDRFYHLAKDNQKFDENLIRFLARSYRLKAIADYEVGPSAIVSQDMAESTIIMAERFVAVITDLIEHSI